MINNKEKRSHFFVLTILLLLGLSACQNVKQPPKQPEVIKITPEEGEKILEQTAREKRDLWNARSFEEFEAQVYHEPFQGGKYIVNGDTPILNKKQLQEFFEQRIQKEPQEGDTVDQLILHQVSGEDAKWNANQKQFLTYCVSKTFNNRYNQAVQSMHNAGKAWSAVSDIKFIHLATEDSNCTASNPNVMFDVRPVNVNGQYLARAFFPQEPRHSRNVLIDESGFQLDPNNKLTLEGILRHELGHTLGFRHEHTRPDSGTCFEDNNFREVTNYDPFSVMHYPQCNGKGNWSLTLTNIDKNGVACIYGAAQGFTIDTGICAPEVVSVGAPTPCSQKHETFTLQKASKGEEKRYGPFKIAPGTLFEAIMEAAGSSGDPDLYVRFDQEPETFAFDCRPYLNGANETCSLDVPVGKRLAFVMVRGYTSGNYNLTVNFISP